jgi:uncharacterized protein (TIGR00255 family)
MGVYLPRDLFALDIEIRKFLSAKIVRGQVTAKIALTEESAKQKIASLKEVYQEWSTVAKALGYDPKEALDFRFLLERMKESDIRTEKLDKDLLATLKEALAKFLKMREAEGDALKLELKKRVQLIRKNLKSVEHIVPTLVPAYRERLKSSLKEIVEDLRLSREIALFAEKVDIAEEVVRLKSHLDQFETMFDDDNVGKALDFLAQEMGREVSTLLAKSGDAGITKFALLMKGDVEKIREQVQNIE